MCPGHHTPAPPIADCLVQMYLLRCHLPSLTNPTLKPASAAYGCLCPHRPEATDARAIGKLSITNIVHNLCISAKLPTGSGPFFATGLPSELTLSRSTDPPTCTSPHHPHMPASEPPACFDPSSPSQLTPSTTSYACMPTPHTNTAIIPPAVGSI